MNDSGSFLDRHNHQTQRQQLYGRKREVEFLREWSSTSGSFASSHFGGGSRLLLLSGGRGVGKRALAKSLAFGTASPSPLFVSGRFHPTRAKSSQRPCPPDRPLSAFWDALNHLFDAANDLTQTNALKAAILSEFLDADDVETLMEMMAMSKPWLAGRRTRTVTETSESARARTGPLYMTSKRMLNTGSVALAVRFVRTISTCLPALVLCIEHLEHADSATFELIDSLLGDPVIGGFLLLVATCREDTETSLALGNLINRANEATLVDGGVLDTSPQPVVNMRVGNLSRQNIHEWVEHRFGSEIVSKDMMQSIVDLVFEKTSGNPQFARYLLEHIDWDMKDRAFNQHTLADLRGLLPNNVSDAYILSLQKQESSVLDVVELVAALGQCRGGESVPLSTLDLVLRRTCTNVVALAQKSGILDCSAALGGQISFPCPEFQSVAYSMISESRRLALHLKIGRRLWKPPSSGVPRAILDEGPASLLFLGAQNLQHSMDVVTDIGELNTIVDIGIGAGKRAMEWSRFPLAACYFELAISALSDRLWNAECYETSLALFNAVSEAYYCSADFDFLEGRLDTVFQNAATFQDKLQAYSTLVYARTAQHRLDDALSLATQILRQVGEPFRSNPSKYHVVAEYYRIRCLFRGKPDRFFLSLPAATSPEKVTAMRMMSFTSFTAYLANPNLSMLMTFRLLTLTITYGLTGPSIVAIALYAYLLSTHMGRTEEGVRFGKLALAFFGRCDEPAWLPRASFMVHGLVYRTSFPFRESLEPLRKANRLALKTGDMEASACMSYAIIPLLFHSGTPLRLVEEELRSHAKLMDALGQQLGLSHLVPTWHIICDLLGEIPCPLLLKGAIKDSNSAFAIAKEEKNMMALEIFYLYRSIFHCLVGEYDLSLQMATKARDALRISEVWLIFFEGLSALSIARNSVGWTRWQMISIGHNAVRSLKRFSHGNFGSKRTLLEAEIAALKGRTTRALSMYNCSIVLAKEQGFLLDEGLAYERLGHFQTTLNSNEAAVPCFNGARRAYDRWGAQSLVNRIEEQLESLGPPTRL